VKKGVNEAGIAVDSGKDEREEREKVNVTGLLQLELGREKKRV